MAVSAEERRFLLAQLLRLAVTDLRALWAAATATTEFADYIVDGYPDVVDAYASAAADMAAVWFEDTLPGPATVADLIPVERLLTSARWALGADGEQALRRLEHTTQRAVFDGARETTLINVERNNIRWARDARADACSFCRLLATRTGKYLYLSRDTAATKVHDDCHCLPIEVIDPDDYELPDHAQAWEEEYLKARANAGTGQVKDILAAWRAQQPEYR